MFADQTRSSIWNRLLALLAHPISLHYHNAAKSAFAYATAKRYWKTVYYTAFALTRAGIVLRHASAPNRISIITVALGIWLACALS